MHQSLYSLLSLSALVAAAPASPPPMNEPTIPGVTYSQEYQELPFPQALTTPSTMYSKGPYKQAIFLSFDGMHQFDLVNFIAQYPNSTFAYLAKHGVVYSSARASQPSDSIPAASEIFSGASARTSGMWWENAYDRSLYPPGSNCKGPIGTVTDYSEAVDLDNTKITGGNALNISALPLKLTTWGTCQAVLPHDFTRVNNVFEVGRGNGLVTAYADKHLAYEFLNGPSGIGLSEGYFPEVAAVNSSLASKLAWDDLHWTALNNWLNNKYANGTNSTTMGPSLFGANFQAITGAQGSSGYLNAAGTPNKTLEMAFQATDAKLGTFLTQLASSGKLYSTLLIIGSKQGQGPVDPKTLKEFSPNVVMDGAGVNVTYFVGLDGGIMYLQNQADSQTAKANLLKNTSLGIQYVLAGDEVTRAGFGSPYLDPRVPDLIIGAKVGTLWVDGKFTFEDHGGFLPQDLNVPLIAFNPYVTPANITEQVSIRQIAPTMLQALGLPLAQLDGYRMEGTPPLPSLF